MRIEDHIYFSPGVKLDELNFDDNEHVINAFRERIESYYFRPIEIMIDNKMAFAAGALQCLLIDTFARYTLPIEGVGDRIREWCIENIPVPAGLANGFYLFFRNGLLHEGHIKKFGQFSFDNDFNQAVSQHNGHIIVNPGHLHTRLVVFLGNLIKRLKEDGELQTRFITKLRADFAEEVALAAGEREEKLKENKDIENSNNVA